MNFGTIAILLLGTTLAGVFPLLFLPLIRRRATSRRPRIVTAAGYIDLIEDLRKTRKGLALFERELEHEVREQAKQDVVSYAR